MVNESKIAVIGLGYVGLRLATAFGRLYPTIGFDIDADRVNELRTKGDKNGEVSQNELQQSAQLALTTDLAGLSESNVYVVTVPTPVDRNNHPDFSPLLAACETVGGAMQSGALVIFESTVFPGATEEICVPALEKFSGLRWKKGFNVGYSPERINPGDHEHSLEKIVKVVSGDELDSLDRVDQLYSSVIDAGTYRCESIQVAEAAKVIENTQRDLNIALVNELAMVFDKLGLDTKQVLDAACTKWNFLNFRPGLVGGHCIGVDPYYLTYKAKQAGYAPDVVLAGRKTNDSTGGFIATKTIKLLMSGSEISGKPIVNVLGFTFKEDCSDVRNTQVVKVVRELEEYGCQVNVCDPMADLVDSRNEYGIDIIEWNDLPVADALIYAVAHTQFIKILEDIPAKVKPGGVVIDVKSGLQPEQFDSDYSYWRF
jgi:UDP-N-acetyl-D-glucosamine/UDP-N-acetyl-D-galactosamine dehydrogenase